MLKQPPSTTIMHVNNLLTVEMKYNQKYNITTTIQCVDYVRVIAIIEIAAVKGWTDRILPSCENPK